MRLLMRTLMLTLLSSLGLVACENTAPSDAPSTPDPAITWTTLSGERPQIIAHRGASGYRPEHSELAYKLALEQGADVLEPDLHMSADGQLIVRHDPYLSTSTDIADRPEFAGRQQERHGKLDWWVSDFTAEELRTLNTRQVFGTRSLEFNDQSPVMTFEDFLDFISSEQILCDCVIPIEPEVKEPAQYVALDLDPLPPLIALLEAHDLNTADSPVVIQSFDPEFLQRLNQLSPVPLAMLHSGPDQAPYDAGGLTVQEIARFADGIGAYKGMVLNPDGTSTGYLEAAHGAGLSIHTWTTRDDRTPITGQTVEDELRALYTLGVDAVFTDHPDTARSVLEQIQADG